jgi:RNA-binding protein
MLTISPDERRALRAQAHPLKPVVMIAQNGLTDAVLKEIELALTSHELIKVRVFDAEREQRDEWLNAACEALGAAPVQRIGNILVLYRPNPELHRACDPRSSNRCARPQRASIAPASKSRCPLAAGRPSLSPADAESHATRSPAPSSLAGDKLLQVRAARQI